MADHLMPKTSILTPFSRTRRKLLLAYVLMFVFLISVIFIILNPLVHSSPSSSPWFFKNLIDFRNPSFFPTLNNTASNVTNFTNVDLSPSPSPSPPPPPPPPPFNFTTQEGNFDTVPNVNLSYSLNVTPSPSPSPSLSPPPPPPLNVSDITDNHNFTAQEGNFDTVPNVNLSYSLNATSLSETKKSDGIIMGTLTNFTLTAAELSEESMINCDIFDGEWVRDEWYPLYEPGSCPDIDEPFNCFLNHRPDNAYEKYRWQPHHCNIPRLNATDMLELLRGKRLVFVGDSLNRNMWESLICILRNSVTDKNKVFEASGREEFRTDGSYSFIFEDYSFSIEFFRSPFLVQEWEVVGQNGTKRETLRLDLIEKASERYKGADVLIFNTAHWWTHEKTLKGLGYYQEGSHVYDELDVDEAFRRALTTWSRWLETSVDPKKTLVFFRGYSVSHFTGGEWNSGGKCDNETEPYRNDANLSFIPSIMQVLDNVLKWMKMPVFYLNVTRMTDYRIDAHPSIYRGQDLTEEERRSPLRYQDCSHWCLPGVPDTWNEIVYSQLLIRHRQRLKEVKNNR